MFFLFVNYIYLIYFTVFDLINHKLLQNCAHVNKKHVEPGTCLHYTYDGIRLLDREAAHNTGNTPITHGRQMFWVGFRL